VHVELTPKAYLAICGLVRDALEIESDANEILKSVADELMNATADNMISSELSENPKHIDALRNAGFIKAA